MKRTLERMTIGKKLVISFGVMLALTLGLSYSAQQIVSIMRQELRGAVEHEVKELDLVGQIKNNTTKMRFTQRGVVLYSMSGDTDLSNNNRKDFQVAHDDIRNKLQSLRALITSDQERSAVSDMESILAKYVESFEQVSRLSLSKQFAPAVLSLKGAGPLGKEMDKNSDVLISLIQERLAEATRHAERASVRSSLTIWSAAIACIAVAVVVLFLVTGISRDLRHLASELTEGSQQIRTAAGQVASSSQSLAQGASEQAASLGETSASSEEITSMTRKNAENSQSAAAMMSEVDKNISEGNRTVDQMVTSMREITSSSDKISKIIKVIDEIAFQTNILALNAAAEAARAGEAGMGFAVVADEVRSLAQRSAQAAKDTAALIEESISKSNEGGTKLKQVTQVIQAITESATKVKTLVDEVSLGSQEQARGIEQISKGIAQMDQVTERTASNAEESASAAEEMSAQAETLNHIVEQLLWMVGGDGTELAKDVKSGPGRKKR